MHELSPEPVAHLSQHRLVPMLLRCALDNSVNSQVRFDRSVVEVRQSGANITVLAKTPQVLSKKHLSLARP